MPLMRSLPRSVNLRTTALIFCIITFIYWSIRPSSTEHVVQPGSPLFANLKATKTRQPSLELAQAACQAHGFPTWKKPGRKVYDLVLFSTELDWLEVRFHTLAPHVDYFVVAEAEKTFTGKPKQLTLQANLDAERFADFKHKIIHHVIKDDPRQRMEWEAKADSRNALLKEVFPTLVGTEKEAKKGDVLIVGDMDEIVRPETAQLLRYCDTPRRLTLRSDFYYYAYQWKRRGEQWPHPQSTTFGRNVANTIPPESLRMDLLQSGLFSYYRRWQDRATLWNAGWHCTFCFNTIDEVQAKMASFSYQQYNNAANRDPQTIVNRFQQGQDPFNRTGEIFDFIDPVHDVPEYVIHQAWKKDRFQYMIQRTLSPYAEFTDAEALIHSKSYT